MPAFVHHAEHRRQQQQIHIAENIGFNNIVPVALHHSNRKRNTKPDQKRRSADHQWIAQQFADSCQHQRQSGKNRNRKKQNPGRQNTHFGQLTRAEQNNIHKIEDNCNARNLRTPFHKRIFSEFMIHKVYFPFLLHVSSKRILPLSSCSSVIGRKQPHALE